MHGRLHFVLAALAVCAGVTPLAAQNSLFGTGDPYRACVMAIETSPEDAFEMALRWRDSGGGAPAEHCAALALIALDDPGAAASRLDNLARRSDAGTVASRAAILSQSGNAWLLANELENAEAAFSVALKLAPRDADIWSDRARARAARFNWAGAESDISNALTFAKKPEFYVLRAAARKEQNNEDGYRSDIDAALSLDATFPDALVERGAIKLEAGDKAGARADWVQVLLRQPEGPAADAVRLHIQAMEIPDALR